jgi:HEAT repeat protein
MDAMDEVGRQMRAFRARATSSAAARLDVLLDLGRLDDPRVVPFLLRVLGDRREATEVRRHALQRLRNGPLPAATRPLVGAAMLPLVSHGSCPELRLPAAWALGEFADLAGVPAALGRLALDVALPIDLRYAAFTSLERAGPTAECVALLRRLSTDETLGRVAHRILLSWRVA